ncbi:RagB/SusD family nutrient uptake outer membrane protein [Chitinophaga sp. 212800010-3]|uniref:RagB/SusD family nutrient uptake outer membrane protein n=1 Tax=unclassified Chitinophaga TaxID=2619133 RepID=UPI002DF5EF4C|nr:RagB/SusD family nutrient uptake outer membrane protein [Chitinophaga sp. 212800010-3]
MFITNNFRNWYRLLLLTLLLTACNHDFLEVTPRDQLSAESIFADAPGGDIFLNDIYNNLPDAVTTASCCNYDAFENWSDNSVCSFHWAMSWQLSVARSYGPANYNPGLYNHDYPAMPFMYDKMYSFIRKCNLFIARINETPQKFPDDWKKLRLSEARFLRVYYYHLLWMAYGGVPLVTELLNRQEQGNAIFKPRSTSAETYKFMTDELAAIANDLPADNTRGSVSEGHASKGAALALKGWIELFNHQYVAAAATNKQLIDELGNGKPYDLFPDYNAQFMAENNNNRETVFAYQHLSGAKNAYQSSYFGPKGTFGGWGAMQPTQNLVDDYVMANGRPISDPASGYDPAHPYKNRETRFYQSIIYDGTVFAGQTFNMKQGEEFGRDLGKENNTGYFRRKGIDERLKGNLALEGSNYNFLRYAEVLLNFAEARIEAGQIDQDVVNAIDKVRVRGGLPTLQQTYNHIPAQQELRDIVRRERRVELAFENKRYWDLIRWRTAETILNQPLYGVDITKENGVWVYNTRGLVHTQQFFPKNYLFPLYQGWIDANPAIRQQNGGADNWANGQNAGY